jgi:uncharacterized protein YktB (UPF0637 family)
VEFSGFTADDFDVFSIPDFAGRMGAIRARIRPRLIELGEDLSGPIESALGIPTFPHVAQHMRRRVNPPVETWVAFTRDRKGYKRWTHYRIAISGAGARVTVFVEDDADDKSQLGANFQAAASGLLSAVKPGGGVRWYTLEEEPVAHPEVAPATVAELGARLQRTKTLKFQAGVPLPAAAAAKLKPAEFEEWALEQVRVLKPFYLAGALPDYRPPTP